jgi:hypothetical protein
MGRAWVEGFLEVTDKATALHAHLTGNFYPPLPDGVKEVITDEFRRYWKKQVTPALLLKRINKGLKKLDGPDYEGPIGLRSLDHFDMFLEGGD